MQLTPIKIETLLRIHASEEPLPKTPSIADALIELQHESLICAEKTGSFNMGCGYELLPRGEKLLRMLLDTPMPVATWIDPRV